MDKLSTYEREINKTISERKKLERHNAWYYIDYEYSCALRILYEMKGYEVHIYTRPRPQITLEWSE